MKRLYVVLFLILSCLLLSACTNAPIETAEVENIPIITSDYQETELTETNISVESSDESNSDISYEEGRITGDYSYEINGQIHSITVDATVINDQIPEVLNYYRFRNDFDTIENVELLHDQTIESWIKVDFTDNSIAIGHGDSFQSEHELSHESVDHMIDSFSVCDVKSVNNIDSFLADYSDEYEIGQYVLRYEYVPESDWDYSLFDDQLEHIPEELELNDDFGDEPFYYYVLRQSIDGIPVGISEDLYYSRMNGVVWNKTGTSSYFGVMENNEYFYNGEDIMDFGYYCCANNDNLEIIEGNLNIIPIESVMNDAIYEISLRSGAGSGNVIYDDIRVYAVELAYIGIVEANPDENSYQAYNMNPDGSIDIYLYPFWLVYFQTGLSTGQGTREVVFVDAFSSEVISYW